MTHKCPITNDRVLGRCIKHKCWFFGTKKHPTGCVKLALGNKDTISIPDLSYLFDMSNRQSSLTVEEGRDKIQSWLTVLNKIENAHKSLKPRCSNCGAEGVSNKCSDEDKCEVRCKIIVRLRSNPVIVDYFDGYIDTFKLYSIASLDSFLLKKIGLGYATQLKTKELEHGY